MRCPNCDSDDENIYNIEVNGKHIEFREIELDNDLLKETQND